MLGNPARKYPAATSLITPSVLGRQAITGSPRECSTDLRDGNQVLANPMDAQRKLTFFKHLITYGFKEINVVRFVCVIRPPLKYDVTKYALNKSAVNIYLGI